MERVFLSAAVCAALVVGGNAVAATDPGLVCEKAAARALQGCIGSLTKESRRCYAESGAACSEASEKVQRILDKLGGKVLARCPDQPTVASAGFGPFMSPTTLVARLEEACSGNTATMAAASFGGPQAAALGSASAPERSCLENAHKRASRFLKKSFSLQSKCIVKARGGRSCDSVATKQKVSKAQARASTKIAKRCAALEELVAVAPARFVARAGHQARCLVATAHADPAPLELDCGPRAGVPVPARAAAVQVVLDEATWGTRCGDGSPYAFWIRLAPEGSPVERVVFHLQGGGACFQEEDCAPKLPKFFDALGDTMPNAGWLATGAANPFKDWTHVFLPYCTQDAHMGNGTTNVFPSITVHRFGAINARAALRYVRDVIWAEMDSTGASGYRPDLLSVAFGGTSAGGFGVQYNYHFVLDELRWVNTASVPDSAAPVDNGLPVGLLSFGAPIAFAAGDAGGWDVRPNLPPYCFAEECILHATLQAASVPRLKATPAQQFLNVTNQVDEVQRDTTFFLSTVDWTNALRAAYCQNQGLAGIRYFLPAIPEPIHGILQSSRFSRLDSVGVLVKDWLLGAAISPDSVVDLVEEGDLAATLGANPFSCSVN
ncbi:MAG: pectin acetylesterase-family hydrolase [Candidatus Krumholzibacteriia bacterium]